MTDSRDRQIAEMLGNLYVEPGPDFWSEVDARLVSAAKTEERQERTGMRVGTRAHDGSPPVLVPTQLRDRRPDTRRQWWSAPNFALTAAAVVVVAGLVVALVASRSTDETTVATDTTSAAEVPATTPPAPSTIADTQPAPAVTGPAVEARLEFGANDLGAAGDLLVDTEGEVLVVPSTHVEDVAGQPLTTNVISDGAGGFVYGLIDFDDARPDRSSRLLHVPAGATAPVVLATEPQLGIGFVVGIVASERGPSVVYTTLLKSMTRSVSLAGGEQTTVAAEEAVAAAESAIVVVNSDQCRSFTVLEPDGSVSTEHVSPRGPDECRAEPTPVFEVAISPDGSTLAWVDEAADALVFADLANGAIVNEIPLASPSNHIRQFDGRGVVILRGGDTMTEIYVSLDGTATVISDRQDALALADFDSYSIAPGLVLGLGDG